MYEIKIKMVKEPVPGYPEGSTKVIHPSDVYKVINPLVRDLPYEVMYALYLTVENELIGIHLVGKGTIDECRSSSREVFAPALLCGGYKVILVHNHPSGSLDISDADKRLTNYLIEASKAIDILFVDHIIIGAFDAGHVSLRQEGIDFNL